MLGIWRRCMKCLQTWCQKLQGLSHTILATTLAKTFLSEEKFRRDSANHSWALRWFFNFLSAAVSTPPTALAFWPFCFFFFFFYIFFFRLGILVSGWFPQLACCFKRDVVRETFSLSCLHFAWMPMLLALQARRKRISWLQSMPHVHELSFYMWRKLVLGLNWLDSIAIQDEGCSCRG
jgi:hypothetical protein